MAPAAIQKKTVLITGCSTGSIGSALSKTFLEHGFHVFAGVRSPYKAQDLAELSNIDLVELDVTIFQSISQCKEFISSRTGGKLDVLVSSLMLLLHSSSRLPIWTPLFVSNNCQINCAGVEGVRPLLDVDITWAKQVYDVNVWGPLLVTQAFGPLVIQAKGIIANLSSIGCKIPMCWAGKPLTHTQPRAITPSPGHTKEKKNLLKGKMEI